MPKIFARIGFVLCIAVLFASCSTSSVAISPTPTHVTLSIPDTTTSLPTSSPTVVVTQTAIPLNLHPQVAVLANNLPEPDDLVLAPDGSIFISDVSDGTIKQYGRDGQSHLILSGLSEPEGMAFLPDGSLIIAEQGKNRLSRYDFSSGALTPFLSLKNNTRNLGVDGILWAGSELIVPDSPNGRILSVSPDGQTVRQIASGLARPTGAWLESTGDLLIADENGNAIFRIRADGTVEKVADFSIPDDVIEDANGNIYVTTLGDNAVHVLLAQTKQDVILVSGLNGPQGIIFDADGNLIVTDSNNHRLLKILIR